MTNPSSRSLLFSLGLRRLRRPQLFVDEPSGRTLRPVPTAIIAGGLFGIGILVYVNVA
jgi:hypothetical protein